MMELIFVVFLVFCVNGQTTGWLFSKKPKEVCYDSLGCFSNKYPFTNSRRWLPRSPEVIGTKFYLASRNTTGNYKELLMTDNHRKCSLKSFCEDNRIILIIHGYKVNSNMPWVKQMVNELLKHDNYNVIVVDWGNGAKEINYFRAVANIRVVGAQVAQLLNVFKNVYDIDPSNTHIIGHSLGAHAAGYAGEYLENIGRITGLDPAGPSFENQDPLVRLDKTDAKFVDIIHTDTETLMQLGFGINQPCGTVDFYPNGGRNQKGCPNSYREQFALLYRGNFELLTNFSCSHLRALAFFTESINSQCDFLAYPCQRINMLSSSLCSTCGTTGCGVMGFHTNSSLTPGKYYLKTNHTAPFCLQ